MKVLKIALISFFSLIVVLCVAAVIIIKTFNVNQYKPQIVDQVKKALNRSIDFDNANLDISFTQGISLNISNLVIGENSAFGKDDFLRIKRISLAVDVLGYITQKKIHVPSILIESPRVTIIRRKDGSINAASFGQPAVAGAAVQASTPAPAPLVLPAVLISSFKIDNGTVTYVDGSFEPALSVDVTDLCVVVNKLSLTDPFAFIVEASVLSAKKNIKLTGKAQLNMATNEISISDLSAVTELSDILLAKIPVAFPMTKGMVLPQGLKGKVDVTLDTVTAGPKGLGALKADVALSGGAAQFGDGKIICSGSLKDPLAAQSYAMEADIQNLKIQDLVAQDKAPVQAEGIASGPVKIAGKGFTPESLKSSLSGTADISLVKTKLKGLNVLRVVLDKISVIPGMSQSIEASLSESLKQKLQQKDTAFSDMKLPVVIENGRILVKDTVIGSEEFIFKGRADAGFDGAYYLEGAFLIQQELSSAFVASVPQLQYLLNDQKQIYIPLKVSGTATNVTFNVDANYIGKKLLENQAKQQIFNALDKALGTPEQGSGDNTAVKESVSSILGNIFKK